MKKKNQSERNPTTGLELESETKVPSQAADNKRERRRSERCLCLNKMRINIAGTTSMGKASFWGLVYIPFDIYPHITVDPELPGCDLLMPPKQTKPRVP